MNRDIGRHLQQRFGDINLDDRSRTFNTELESALDVRCHNRKFHERPAHDVVVTDDKPLVSVEACVRFVTALLHAPLATTALADGSLQRALLNVKRGFVLKRAAARAKLPEFDTLREEARAIKDHTLAHLDLYLEAYERKVRENGGAVHYAATAADASSASGAKRPGETRISCAARLAMLIKPWCGNAAAPAG